MRTSTFIPANITRAVRQRDGFCCVICGELLCEYHHIIPDNEGGPTNAENLILLCRNHHKDADNGVIGRQDLKKMQVKPLRDKESGTRYKFFSGEGNRIEIAGSSIHIRDKQRVNILVLRDGSKICVELIDGRPTFSFNIPDLSGNTSFIIEQNVIRMDPNSLYDAKFSGGKLKIWHGKNLPVLQVSFRESRLVFDDLRIFNSGEAIRITDTFFPLLEV